MTTTLEPITIQRFDDLYDATPSATVRLSDALGQIVDGTYRHAIAHARRLYAQQGEDAYKAAKNTLPQWTFGGTFTPSRAKDHLVQHSGICHADIDHLDDLPHTKCRLQDDPHVLYCFTSPRGDGLKYGVRVAVVTSDEQYKHAWQYLADTHATTYQVTWDRSGKDICRLCFVSWDPACYINLDAAMYPVPPAMVTPPSRPVSSTPMPRDARERYAQRGIANAIKIIAESTDGGLHEARRRAAYLLGGYVGGGLLTFAEAYEALREAVEGHTKHLTASLKTITDCLKAGEAEPITLETLETEWQAWKKAHPLPRLLPHARPERTPPLTYQDRLHARLRSVV